MEGPPQSAKLPAIEKEKNAAAERACASQKSTKAQAQPRSPAQSEGKRPTPQPPTLAGSCPNSTRRRLARLLHLPHAIFRGRQAIESPCGLGDIGMRANAFHQEGLDRVADHISIRASRSARMPIRWHLHRNPEAQSPKVNQSELKEFTAACEDELCRTPSPAAQTETNPTSRTIRRQEIRIQVPPISRIIPPNLTAKNCQTDGQITRSKPDEPQSFGALGTGWGRAILQGPVYAESSSYTRVKPPPRQNDSCSIFRTDCGKPSPKL